MLYRIKNEYLELWGTNEENVLVDITEIKKLAYEWSITIKELMKQVEAID